MRALRRFRVCGSAGGSWRTWLLRECWFGYVACAPPESRSRQAARHAGLRLGRTRGRQGPQRRTGRTVPTNRQGLGRMPHAACAKGGRSHHPRSNNLPETGLPTPTSILLRSGSSSYWKTLTAKTIPKSTATHCLNWENSGSVQAHFTPEIVPSFRLTSRWTRLSMALRSA